MKNIFSNLFKRKPQLTRRLGFSIDELTQLHLMNTELLPIIKRAKTGSITAQYDLYLSFLEGKDVKKDLEIASYYLMLTMHTVSKDFENDDNIIHYLNLLLELADIEKEMGNYDKMEEICLDVVLFMQKHIAIEYWDFSIFTTLEALMNDKKFKPPS